MLRRLTIMDVGNGQFWRPANRDTDSKTSTRSNLCISKFSSSSDKFFPDATRVLTLRPSDFHHVIARRPYLAALDCLKQPRNTSPFDIGLMYHDHLIRLWMSKREQIGRRFVGNTVSLISTFENVLDFATQTGVCFYLALLCYVLTDVSFFVGLRSRAKWRRRLEQSAKGLIATSKI